MICQFRTFFPHAGCFLVQGRAWCIRESYVQTYGIEIGGGLGPLKGKVWRIGLMGESSTEAHVLTLLNSLEEMFIRGGWLHTAGVALQAASRVYGRMIS